MKILIIEDEPIDRKLAHGVLTSAGHSVNTADCAGAALASLATELPNLILMDMNLPGMDGLALTRELRSNMATRDIPIVAISAFPERYTKAHILEAGCNAFIRKPFSTRTLPSELSDVARGAVAD